MTENPKFSPQRSAAIRQLLIENVEAEPRRHGRHLRALLAGLVVTGIVASGTAALALNRDSLFGAPLPGATATSSATAKTAAPSPTPTATQPGAAPITVGTAPIAPHDVVSPPTGAGWSLQLPAPSGTCLADTAATNVSDGLALVTVGPDFVDDTATPDGCNPDQDGLSVSLVNTQSGELVWSREWSWTTEPEQQTRNKARAIVLDDSNRIVVSSRRDLAGPNEIIDLATGATVAAFTPDEEGETVTAMYAVPGDSGDVYAIFEDIDADGNPLPHVDLRRFDPLNPTEIVWSTPLDADDINLDTPQNRLTYSMVQYLAPGSTSYTFALLDLSTGELSPRDQLTSYRYFTGYSIRPSSLDTPSGTPVTLTGLNDSGEQIWTRTEPFGSNTVEAMTVDAEPGARASTRVGNGQFLIANSQAVTLVDGATGQTIWTANPPACGLRDGYQPLDASLSSDRGAITLDSSEGSCRFDAATGAQLADASIPWNMFRAYGESLVYVVTDGTGTAYDAGSGEAIWTTATSSYNWLYAGGYLVAFDGTTLRSIG